MTSVGLRANRFWPLLHAGRCWFWAFVFIISSQIAWVAFGAPQDSEKTNAVPVAAVTNLNAIAPAEIALQAESALGVLRAIQEESRSNTIVSMIEQQLPAVAEEIGTRSEENARILAHSGSLELFRRMAGGWQDLSQELGEWNRSLTRLAKQLQTSSTNVAQIEKTWELTRGSEQGDKIPAELSQRIAVVITEAHRARQQVQNAIMQVLTLQSRVAEQNTRVHDSLEAIELAREQVVRHLFVRDRPALWSAGLLANASQRLTVESQNTLTRQWKELRAYSLRKQERFLIQVALLIALLGVLFTAQRKLHSLSRGERDLEETSKNLGAPFASALMLTLLLSPWIYPHAPRLLWSILGSLALGPAIVVLRGLLRRSMFGAVNVLAAFYLVDQLRSVAAAQPLVWRLLFLAEMIAGFIYCWIALRAATFPARNEDSSRFGKVMSVSGRTALGVFGLVAVLNVIGYGRLSSLVGNVLLSSAYLALLLYAVTRVADALLTFGLRLSPLARLAMIQHHASLIAASVQKALQWVAILLWLAYVLQRLALGHSILAALNTTADTTIRLGKHSFTLGHLFLFALILWVSVLASRFMRFVLEEELYPHLHLAAGLHYSISKTLHYVVLLVGFLIALTMIGIDLTNLTIVAGAVGVGLGFGMQNIVNNFVSGIILLFERPVKVGDVIQLDTTEGVVKRIGIRASIVRTLNGSEIIVPNAKLISDPVTNWTFSERRRLLTVPIAVTSETEPQRVIELLKRTASEHSLVSKERPVQALLTNLNNGTANYELRAWTDQSEDWQQVRSDLITAVKTRLAAEGIGMR